MEGIKKLDRVIVEIKKMLLRNENLKKLIYYNTPDALAKASVTDRTLVDPFIKTTPAIYMIEDGTEIELNSFIVIYTPTINFTTKLNDVTFIVDIFTRKEILELDNNQLRLHQMLGEISSSLDNQRVSFAGRINLSNATYVVVGNRYVGFQLEVTVIDEAIENEF